LKLPIRVLPTVRNELAAGPLTGGVVRPLAAWVCHLRGSGAKVTDARAGDFLPFAGGPLPEAVRLVLRALDPELAENEAVVAAVIAEARELGQP
jgi:hypothetical protein